MLTFSFYILCLGGWKAWPLFFRGQLGVVLGILCRYISIWWLKVKKFSTFTACWNVILFLLKSDLLCMSNMWFWPGVFFKTRSEISDRIKRYPVSKPDLWIRSRIWSGIQFWTPLILTNYMLVRSLASNMYDLQKKVFYPYIWMLYCLSCLVALNEGRKLFKGLMFIFKSTVSFSEWSRSWLGIGYEARLLCAGKILNHRGFFIVRW